MPAVVAWVAAWSWQTWVAIALTAYSAYDGTRQRRLARQRAKDAYNASLQDRLVMQSTVDGARSRVYGMVRNVDGLIFKGAWGPNNQYYTMVVALAGHECESIEKVYFNDLELELASDGAGGYWVQTEPFLRRSTVSERLPMSTAAPGSPPTVTLPHTPIAGSVGASIIGERGSVRRVSVSMVGNVVTATSTVQNGLTPYVVYQYATSTSKARVWKYLGTDTQDIGSDLLQSRFPTLINTAGNDDRFAGICALVVELEYDQDAFPTGVVGVTGLIKGAKIPDPRTGVTAWTQNPAVIAYDWSLYAYAGGCLASEVIQPAFIAAANACDISTGFVTDAGTETRPLYQCDTVCSLDAPPDKTFDEIVESMAGKWGWSGGQLTMVAGVYRAPVATITNDWLSDAEGIGLVKDQPRTDVVNIYRPSIAAADVVTDPTTSVTHAYALVPAPEVRSAEYIAADGQELPREVTLGAVVHNVHAQHVCAVMLRDQRFFMSLSLPCKMHAWQLQLFDVVMLNLPIFGFVNQTFEVVGWKFSLEKGVILSLKKIDASIFDIAATFELPNAAFNTALVLPWVVPGITGLAATSGSVALDDGTQQSRVQVTWDASTSQAVLQSGKIEVQYADATQVLPAGDWPSQFEEGGATGTLLAGLLAGGLYLIRVRAVTTLRVRSDWSVMVMHQVADAPAVGGDNLLLNSSFEVDSNADGLADSWSAYSLGTTGTITRSTPASGLYGAKVQRLAATGLAATSGDRVGITQTVSVAGMAGQSAILSAYLLGGTGTPKAVMQVDWRNVSNVSQGVTTTGEFSPDTTYLTRVGLKDVIPATTVSAIVSIWMANRTGGTGAAQLDVDAAQLEIGGVMTGYAPNAAEILAGAVNTLNLANDAATEVRTTYVAGPVSFSSGA